MSTTTTVTITCTSVRTTTATLQKSGSPTVSNLFIVRICTPTSQAGSPSSAVSETVSVASTSLQGQNTVAVSQTKYDTKAQSSYGGTSNTVSIVVNTAAAGAKDASSSSSTSSSSSSSGSTSSSSSSQSSTETSTSTTTSGSSSSTTNSPQVSRTPSPPSSSSSGDGLSTGAIAGIAVGAAAAGALIALLLYFFFFRKRRNSRSADYTPAPPYDTKAGKSDSPMSLSPSGAAPVIAGGMAAGAGVSAGAGAAAAVDNYIPQPVSDTEVSRALSALRTQINNHVLSFYNLLPGKTPSAEAVANALGEDTLTWTPKLQALLAKPSTRPAAMRALLASIIVSRIGRNSDPATTFLPPDILSSFQELSRSSMNEDTRAAFLSRWRAMTFAMLPSPTADLQSGEQVDNIRAAVRIADAVLDPFAKMDNGRQQNLEEIMKRGARLGCTLFSHPSTFDFDWQGTNDTQLVVFPGLLQTTDEAGAPLAAPRSFGDKEIARL